MFPLNLLHFASLSFIHILRLGRYVKEENGGNISHFETLTITDTICTCSYHCMSAYGCFYYYCFYYYYDYDYDHDYLFSSCNSLVDIHIYISLLWQYFMHTDEEWHDYYLKHKNDGSVWEDTKRGFQTVFQMTCWIFWISYRWDTRTANPNHRWVG